MRTKLGALAAALLLTSAARAAAAPCVPSATSLCLSDGRFEVSVAWKDFQGTTGDGQAVSLTADTGYFWFFSASNIELIVKVLDARAINQKFWVFFGALSNVEYTLTVTDSVTGAVKTYQNPSGQFASVGDTTAFEGSASPVSSSRQTVVAEGTSAPPSTIADIQRWIERASAASVFTPCPDTYFGFDLAGCRFHIEVTWDDGHGQTDVGQAVQLTNDTGYFWFFSPSNVELMVKVLDARAINGKFWVFFGALSNVQYTIAVKDSLTGASRTYRNAAGTFASVGDTGAFRGGYSVAPVADPSHAVSGDLDMTGGSITATGADGAVFTLEIPPQALPSPETVTLTPVSRIDRFPFSGGLVAGVEIEPNGLDLMLPATLTIQPGSAPSPDRTLPYSYVQGGEDFILYPRDPDSSSLRIPIVRLGGYGVGQGDAADAQSQAERAPTGPLAPYLQRYAHDVYRYALGVITRAQLSDSGIQIYRQAYTEVVAPLLNQTGAAATRPSLAAKEGSCILGGNPDAEVRAGIENFLTLLRQRQLLPGGDPDPLNMESLLQPLRDCLQQAFDRCVAHSDPFEALFMLDIARQLQMLGEEDPRLTTFIESGLLERCVRFELDFESKVVEESNSRGVNWVQRLKYRAQHVPLRFNYAGNAYSNRAIWEGACSLLPEDAAFYYVTGGQGIRVTVNTQKSWFNAFAAWIGAPTMREVRILYDPGYPEVKASATFPNGGISDFPMAPFASDYGLLHERESTYLGYMAKYWRQLRFNHGWSQNGGYFAEKSYERTIPTGPDSTLTEETWFFLKHTPDAPMPDCQ